LSDKINSATCASSWNYILEYRYVMFSLVEVKVMEMTILARSVVPTPDLTPYQHTVQTNLP